MSLSLFNNKSIRPGGKALAQLLCDGEEKAFASAVELTRRDWRALAEKQGRSVRMPAALLPISTIASFAGYAGHSDTCVNPMAEGSP